MAEDYPRTLVELERRFSDDAACRQYLFALRWPAGFSCERCQADANLQWDISDNLQFTSITGYAHLNHDSLSDGPLLGFQLAEDYHQRYLEKNPGGYTCHFLRD